MHFTLDIVLWPTGPSLFQKVCQRLPNQPGNRLLFIWNFLLSFLMTKLKIPAGFRPIWNWINCMTFFYHELYTQSWSSTLILSVSFAHSREKNIAKFPWIEKLAFGPLAEFTFCSELIFHTAHTVHCPFCELEFLGVQLPIFVVLPPLF